MIWYELLVQTISNYSIVLLIKNMWMNEWMIEWMTEWMTKWNRAWECRLGDKNEEGCWNLPFCAVISYNISVMYCPTNWRTDQPMDGHGHLQNCKDAHKRLTIRGKWDSPITEKKQVQQRFFLKWCFIQKDWAVCSSIIWYFMKYWTSC